MKVKICFIWCDVTFSWAVEWPFPTVPTKGDFIVLSEEDCGFLDQKTCDLYDSVKFKGRDKYNDRKLYLWDLLSFDNVFVDEVWWHKDYVEIWIKQDQWEEEAEDGTRYWTIIDPLNLGEK